MRPALLISRYLLRTIVPYFLLSWLLLSVVLFIQQASRFSDIFFNVNIPATLVWQLMIALIPNVIAFTCPMAVLAGTVIGLAKMQGDSELVAIRAAGVGNLQITLPIVLLGIVLSVFAFVVNLKGVPLAARLVRQIAIKTAIQKLESPIEPGIFNSDVAGYTIYVRRGDMETGRWNDIFVFQQDVDGTARVITSTEGRIDIANDASELVLENANVLSLPPLGHEGKYVSEQIGDVRFGIKTKRNELIKRLSNMQGTPEEMGLAELSEYVTSREGSDRTEGQILWQRRLILSVTPLIFCLLGSGLVLRFNRGGRGFGAALAFAGLTVYYLIAFLGEQLIRVGSVNSLIGGLLPIAASIVVIGWLYVARRRGRLAHLAAWFQDHVSRLRRSPDKLQLRNVFVDLTTGLRDLDLIVNLIKYFVFAMAFTSVIFCIFTAFELWKFAGAMEGGIGLLARYLLYLLPFVYLQLAPTCVMIAVLATYVIKSRNNELVTWVSAGQSIYRLLIPAILACLALGVTNWFVQESLVPYTNRVQDEIRLRIRNRGAIATQQGRVWVADAHRIYTFDLNSLASDNESPGPRRTAAFVIDGLASDNEKQLRNLALFEISDDKGKLQAVYRAEKAVWTTDGLAIRGQAEKVYPNGNAISVERVNDLDLPAGAPELSAVIGKPSHLTAEQISTRFAESGSNAERQVLAVSLQKRYATVFLPLIIALLTAPFAIELSRKGKLLAVGYAVGLWLLFIGSISLFEQLGLNGLLSPAMSVWSPIALFALIGIYFISRTRT